jgi:superfamily II RNA helicase
MPTRTVVFTDITKFINDKKKILSSSEYLQMCGRAGRRGKDDKGYVFILIADKNAKLEPTKVIGMASGSGSIVKSQFRLSYKVIINFFYRNIKNIMQFFKESYIENSNFISMPEIKKKIEELTEKQKNLKKIDCKNEIETISEYYSSSVNLRQYRNKLFSNQYIKPLFKTQGRIILYNSKKSLKNIYVLVVNHYTDYDGEIWCLRVDGDENIVTEFENSKERKLKKNQGQFAQKGIKNGKYFSYFHIYNEDVVDICDFTLNCLSKKKSTVGELIADDNGFEFYLDKNLNIILDELLNINKDLDNNKNQIKVVNYLKVCRNDIDVSQNIKEKEK